MRKGSDTTVRLVHFSDIHVTTPARWAAGDWLSKRLTGWLNWWVYRRHIFRQTEPILAALVARLRAQPPDALVFSGDATMLGFEAELARAIELLAETEHLPCERLAVPGNHDYYTRTAAATGLFEKHFASWQQGQRIEEHTYPFARQVGHVWLIGVNSCTGNWRPTDASGAVGADQLARLRRLLRELPPGPRILVTHYPVALADGRPEPRVHRLRDLGDLLAIAAQGGVGLWLHGHRHHPYEHVASTVAGFPIVCIGSLTQEGCASYGEYVIAGRHVRATRHSYCPGENDFQESKTLEFEMPDQ